MVEPLISSCSINDLIRILDAGALFALPLIALLQMLNDALLRDFFDRIAVIFKIGRIRPVIKRDCNYKYTKTIFVYQTKTIFKDFLP